MPFFIPTLCTPQAGFFFKLRFAAFKYTTPHQHQFNYFLL